MRKIILLVSLVFTTSVLAGCIATKESGKSFAFSTETEHVLYDLMEARCKALSSANLEELKALYMKNSAEPEWLADKAFPLIRQWPATYKISRVKNITVVGRDAAATYKIFFYNDYKSDGQLVDVLYEMENGEWKIDSVNIRK